MGYNPALLSNQTENTINVFISSLKPERRQRAKNVFNWIKHAAEPWTPESLAEAIVVYECAEFRRMIIVQNHNIRFSHSSFYELPKIGIENTDEPTAFVHAQIAKACLHYFWLE
ncbi:uncharacterized protein TrAtP1_010151 [Trichoderma atroviride]|uniref:uncharacterized protein n=1 Tax=Hypocrea atroviridis TaxID=63577 RepID=UPI00331721E7|nr:hypothetical protein TrAtP1_010151 [Trichoderma atroviride]